MMEIVSGPMLHFHAHFNYGHRGGHIVYRVHVDGQPTEIFLHKISGGRDKRWRVLECYLQYGDETFDMLPHATNKDAEVWIRQQLSAPSARGQQGEG